MPPLRLRDSTEFDHRGDEGSEPRQRTRLKVVCLCDLGGNFRIVTSPMGRSSGQRWPYSRGSTSCNAAEGKML